MDSIIIRQPDDFHLHLRDGDMLATVIKHSAGQFARAMVMPNIQPPAVDADAIAAYRQRIIAATPDGANFTPLMTLYLTDKTTPEQLLAALNQPGISAVKYYPAGATTNSHAGVTDHKNCLAIFAILEEQGIPLSIHAEVADPKADIFAKEELFIQATLIPLKQQFPRLKLVCEHVSTRALVDFVLHQDTTVAATITPHHLLLNRNDIFSNGLNPHHYCLPILKSAEDQLAVVQAALSGNPKFFAGTDSAPHLLSRKLSSSAPAGIFNAPVALPIYATVFADNNALDKLENFCSVFGANFYNLPLNNQKVRIFKKNWSVLPALPFADDAITPLCAGENLEWSWEAL